MEIKEVTAKDFDSEINSNDSLVLVDFFATWCGPCKMLRPVLEEIANENICKIISVDIDKEEELAEKYGIYSIPTLVLFRNGKEERRILGLRPKDDIIKFIEG